MASPPSMKAVVIRRPGPPDVFEIEDLPIPVPQCGEVLIRVKAFGINRSELFTRQGLCTLLRRSAAHAAVLTMGFGLGETVKAGPLAPADSKARPGTAPLDARTEAKKIAFDRVGRGEKVLMISGFPQPRRSWNRLVPLLSAKFETIPADLPSFGDSGREIGCDSRFRTFCPGRTA